MAPLMGTHEAEKLDRLAGHLPAALVGIVALMAYLPALQNGFVLDDTSLVLGNPYIKSWKFLPQMLTQDVWNVWDRHNYWRPVFNVSLALDYSLWGLNPLGFHLTNLLLHAVNSALVFVLGKKLGGPGCGLLASSWFALHPLQAHAVNVVSARADLLAGSFAVVSLHAFLAIRAPLFAFATVLALLTKENSMFLPAALAAWWVILGSNTDRRRLVLWGFAILGVYVAARYSLGFDFSLPPSIVSYEASWDARGLLALKVLALYFVALLHLFQVPHPLWTVSVPTTFYDPHVAGGLLAALAIAGAFLWALKKDSAGALGIAWLVVFYIPISNLKELNQPMAEHWLYLPMVGLSLAFGSALAKLFRRGQGRRLVVAAAGSAVCSYLVFAGAVTWEKSKVYRNTESFIRAAIEANPGVAKLYSILGSAYLARGEAALAKAYYSEALALDPGDLIANYRMGSFLHEGGQKERARIYLERVVQSRPAPLYQILIVAHAWEMLGDKEKALSFYRKASDRNPWSAHVRSRVAALENSLGYGHSSP